MQRRFIPTTLLVQTYAALCLMITNPGGYAQESASGDYTRINAGINLVQDIKIKDFFGPTPGLSARLDTGFRLDFEEGLNINKWVSVGGEVGFIYNGFKDIDGQLMHVPFLITARLQYQNQTGFVPYVGIGVGGDVSLINLNNVGPLTPRSNLISVDGIDSDLNFAYQGVAGLRWMMTDWSSITLGYKFLGTTAPSWVDDHIKFGEVYNHSVLLGIDLDW